MVEIIKEDKEEYFAKFPQKGYYIIRWLDSGGYHLYPNKDYELPRMFNTKKEAQEYIDKWLYEAKIVSGLEASSYPIPKRW